MTDEQTIEGVIKENLEALESGKVEQSILRLVADSPLDSYDSKRTLAEAIILVRLMVRQLTQLALEERLTGDQARALPGLLNQVNKLLQTLQVVSPKDDDETFM